MNCWLFSYVKAKKVSCSSRWTIKIIYLLPKRMKQSESECDRQPMVEKSRRRTEKYAYNKFERRNPKKGWPTAIYTHTLVIVRVCAGAHTYLDVNFWAAVCLFVCIDHMIVCSHRMFVNICFRMSVWPIGREEDSNGVRYFHFRTNRFWFSFLSSCSTHFLSFALLPVWFSSLQSGILGFLSYTFLIYLFFFYRSFVDVYLFLAHFARKHIHTQSLLAVYSFFQWQCAHACTSTRSTQWKSASVNLKQNHTQTETHTHGPTIRYFGLVYIIRFSERVSLNLDQRIDMDNI